jgi:hypothetical protein
MIASRNLRILSHNRKRNKNYDPVSKNKCQSLEKSPLDPNTCSSPTTRDSEKA